MKDGGGDNNGGGKKRRAWKTRLIWLLGLCLCQLILWLALEAQARQLLLPGFKNERPFSLTLPFAAASDLQLSHNSKYLSALSGGELLIFRLGAPLPLLRERAVAAGWLPDRDVLALIKTEGADTVLVTLDLTGAGRDSGAAAASRITRRAVLPAAPRRARFAFYVYRDEMYIQPEFYPSAQNEAEPVVWFVEARGVTAAAASETGDLAWAPPGVSPPAPEWSKGVSAFVSAPDGFSRLRLVWFSEEECRADWEILPNNE
ncbi:MAG: hypothetical protein LBH21_08075 [Gracilibacteraceae bacterium]|nr:hypothetical protein [Gracilibacteraceae bacterium]